MLTILGHQFMTDKEASTRYGYSISWFRKMRSLKMGPKHIQIIGGGKVLYPLEATDEWFSERMKEKE